MKTLNKNWFWWILPLSLIICNFYLASLTWEEVRQQVAWVKNIPQQQTFKLRHILQYGLLAFTFSLSFHKNFPHWSLLKMLLYTVSFTSLCGTLDEWHQSFVPTRIFSKIDIFWNCMGAFCGALLYIAIISFMIKSKSNKPVESLS